MQINAQRTKPIKLDSEFVFVEREKSNSEFLHQTIKSSPHGALLGDRVHVLHDSFEQAQPGIIAHIKSRGRVARAIFFSISTDIPVSRSA